MPRVSVDRSATMRKVRSKNTGPELKVRKLVFALGYRFRLHRADLPGTPDLAFIGLRKVIFVHGCWWHGHVCKRGARPPKTRRSYWLPKIERNRRRDSKAERELRKTGWGVLVIWECELSHPDRVSARLKRFLVRGTSSTHRSQSRP